MRNFLLRLKSGSSKKVVLGTCIVYNPVRKRGTDMKYTRVAIGFVACYFQASLPSVSAQALGEYGRTLGGVAQRQGSSVPKTARGSDAKEKVRGGLHGVGDLGVQPLQKPLIVAANSASLYPNQDDEALKIEELSRGAMLIPVMYATSGSGGWYMVKTQKGTIGWVKSMDVREESARK
jgi:hypothetical protein